MDADQLREQLRRIAASDPVDEHSARTSVNLKAIELRRKRRLRASALLAASVVIIGAVAFAVVGSGDNHEPVRVHPAQSIPASTTARPGTTTSTTQPDQASQLCHLQRDPSNHYSLAQPATITLPGGATINILPGDPLTAPESVTLDGDGAAPGDSGSAAALLWGAATEGGPFAGLESTSPGATLTLRQSGPTECIQQWRVTQVVTSQDALTPSRPVLRLVGFAPTDTGPTTMFYVEAVPDGSSHTTSPTPTEGVNVFDDFGIRAPYPSSWQREQSGQPSIGSPTIWLSNQPLHDPCSATVSPGGALNGSCGYPTDRLEPGGFALRFSRSDGPTRPDPAQFDRLPGSTIQIDGQPANIASRKPRADECGTLGATRVIDVNVIVHTSATYELLACLRGPDIEGLEDQIKAMAQSTTFPT